jgi:hypothetical protein
MTSIPFNGVRVIVLAVVGVAAIAGAIGVSAWISKQDVHDYSTRRQPRPDFVRLTEDDLNRALDHAFAFRTMTVDGRQRFVFNSGLCLLAHRAQSGQEVTWDDRVVQQAVVNMWKEPWMQEFSQAELAVLNREFQIDSSDSEGRFPSAGTAETMTARFVDALVQQPEFEASFRSAVELSSRQMNLPVVWVE